VGGSIANLLIGNTEVIARKIQALTGTDLFQIEQYWLKKTGLIA
jgi:flavodoxin